MSKLLQERWKRLAFGSNLLNEQRGGDTRLIPLIDMFEIGGFYFAGSETVILGNLDDMSGKNYPSQYPYDEYMGEGPFHIQVSVEDNGKFKIHDYSAVDDKFCSGTMPKEGVEYDTAEDVIAIVQEMVQCYEEFMDAYCQIRDAGGTLDAEEDYAPAYINDDHPVAKELMKK